MKRKIYFLITILILTACSTQPLTPSEIKQDRIHELNEIDHD